MAFNITNGALLVHCKSGFETMLFLVHFLVSLLVPFLVPRVFD